MTCVCSAAVIRRSSATWSTGLVQHLRRSSVTMLYRFPACHNSVQASGLLKNSAEPIPLILSDLKSIDQLLSVGLVQRRGHHSIGISINNHSSIGSLPAAPGSPWPMSFHIPFCSCLSVSTYTCNPFRNPRMPGSVAAIPNCLPSIVPRCTAEPRARTCCQNGGARASAINSSCNVDYFGKDYA